MILQTLAEQSQFRLTGRLEEVEALCAAFAERWPEAVRSFVYGQSAEGRPLRALLVSRGGAFTPETLRERAIPLLLVQAGIHPGESDGKDAGFAALRELLGGDPLTEVEGGSHIEMRPPEGDPLARVAILFVPAFNADGHERTGRWNRPNQIGPEETGWRATAHNLNLNRDYTKADAPEMQALLALVRDWDPLVTVDMHVTNGADFEPDVSIQVEPIQLGDPQLHATGIALRAALIDKLNAQGSLALPFYPDLVVADDPASGFHVTAYSPRYSTGYFPTRNRYTVLVETHSWKDYATRTRVSRNAIIGLTELLAAHGAPWHAAALEADRRALGGQEIVLDVAVDQRETATLDFRGYAYTRDLSPISGEPVTVYDPTTPQIWRVPYYGDVLPSLVVRAPRGGYLVPREYVPLIADKLALHGLVCRILERNVDRLDTEVFRATGVRFSPVPFEGRTRLALQGAWRAEPQSLPAGGLFVPIAQPGARLLMTLLEPQAPDSLAAWGFFNSHYELKEYVEPYVTEIFAHQILEQDPALADEFRRRLAEDPAFAADPQARREFFERRHTSWDTRYAMYPILRIHEAPIQA
ncbi:M14 family zinc carboxypeptidase [Nonomuraea guangzhouensis]|uniref:M14 family zinc carboxypeptidase n=1 Tax=Nonomuraea guangzhouensis TaxID=1291555 RepID=A0ABW4GVL6_9ACTN|nr:M14 family zinc carboxypeptidase [Nonomuraea guangzhouensis]